MLLWCDRPKPTWETEGAVDCFSLQSSWRKTNYSPIIQLLAPNERKHNHSQGQGWKGFRGHIESDTKMDSRYLLRVLRHSAAEAAFNLCGASDAMRHNFTVVGETSQPLMFVQSVQHLEER